MSRNILDELYDYDLFHLTEIEDTDGSYKKALDRLVKAEAELKKAYPDSTEILDEYQSADIELHNLANRNCNTGLACTSSNVYRDSRNEQIHTYPELQKSDKRSHKAH